MGRGPTNENTNMYFQARKKAATYNERLWSREGAAELLGISVSTLADYELGNTKVVPVDKVVLMADLYNAPELITGYCMRECPVHGFLPLATEEKSLEGIALRLLQNFNEDSLKNMGNTREIAGKSERTIKDTERKREEDLYCVFRIEKATEMYREECEKSGSEEAKRRYRELSMMYLDEKPYTVQEISEVENISDKTVYKDIGIACGIVAIYLLGADF